MISGARTKRLRDVLFSNSFWAVIVLSEVGRVLTRAHLELFFLISLYLTARSRYGSSQPGRATLRECWVRRRVRSWDCLVRARSC